METSEPKRKCGSEPNEKTNRNRKLTATLKWSTTWHFATMTKGHLFRPGVRVVYCSWKYSTWLSISNFISRNAQFALKKYAMWNAKIVQFQFPGAAVVVTVKRTAHEDRQIGSGRRKWDARSSALSEDRQLTRLLSYPIVYLKIIAYSNLFSTLVKKVDGIDEIFFYFHIIRCHRLPDHFWAPCLSEQSDVIRI